MFVYICNECVCYNICLVQSVRVDILCFVHNEQADDLFLIYNANVDILCLVHGDNTGIIWYFDPHDILTPGSIFI